MSRCLISIRENIKIDKLLKASSILKYNKHDILEYFYENNIFISWANSGHTVHYKKFNNDIVVILGNLFSNNHTIDEFCDIAYNNSYEAFQKLDGYVLLFIKKNNDFIISNDVLGFMKFYKQDNKHVYSTEMKSLQYLFHNKINSIAISQKNFSFFTAGIPLLSNMSLFPSGKYQKIKNSKIIEFDKSLNLTKIKLNDNEIIQKIDELLTNSYYGYRLQNHSHKISLSGGFDSRFVLAKSLEMASNVSATTFSGTKDLENLISERLSNISNIKKTTFNVKKLNFNTIEEYIKQYEEISSVDSLFYTEFIESINGNHVFISGLLTDLLTGSHFKFSKKTNPSVFLYNSSQTALTDKDIKLLDIKIIKKYIDDQYYILNKNYNDYQSITLLNMKTRQKLWVSFVYKAILNTGNGVVPTYNIKFIEFMLSLSFDKLKNQYIYRKFFKTKYPALAKVISTYDYQSINEIDSKLKKIKQFLLKQFYRFYQKYSTVELIEKNYKQLLDYIKNNKNIYDIYFTDSLYKDLIYSLNNFTQIKRYINKLFNKRILTDISIMIIVNTIVFHKIFTNTHKTSNIDNIRRIK